MKMKITLALAFVLCFALSAFAQGDMKKDDKMSAKMTPDQMLMNQEQMAWKAISDKRWDDFGKMLADSYQGFYDHGIESKTTELAGVKNAINNATLSDIKVTWIDKDVAIVTAIAKVDFATADGKTANSMARTASIWKKNGKDWQIVYHTDIEMKPDEMKMQ